MSRRRKHLTTPDGWSTIIRGPTPRPPGVDPLETLHDPGPSLAEGEHEDKHGKYTFEQTLAKYNRVKEEYTATERYKAVMRFVEEVLKDALGEGGRSVRRCVLLGLGGVRCEKGGNGGQSLRQLVLVCGVAGVLGWCGEGGE